MTSQAILNSETDTYYITQTETDTYYISQTKKDTYYINQTEKNTYYISQTVVKEIYEKLEQLPRDDPNSDGAFICLVPKSFSSTKPEAFIPQFVGLGPYHHSNVKLIITENLKLSVAKRMLNINHLLTETGDENLDVSGSTIQSLYHTADVSSTYDPSEVEYILTVDGLFLLTLLHCRAADLEGRYSFYYNITGKRRGLALLNSDRVELTTDGIIKDVFMLENQIPTQVLHKISQVFIIIREDLDQVMLNFCKAFCPLVHPSSSTQLHGEHLLDLMYKLVAASPQPQPPPQPHRTSCLLYLYAIFVIILWVFLCTFVYIAVIIVHSIRSTLVKVIPWSGAILGEAKRKIINPLFFFLFSLELFNDNTFMIKSVFTFSLHILNSHIIGLEAMTDAFLTFHTLGVEAMGKLSLALPNEAETIPSAIDLDHAWVQLIPVEGIASIKFDVIKKQLYLPRIKVDSTSEVIMRNLVAYESLNDVDCFNFAWYIELMRALIQSAQDVRLLVHEKIIHTQLSDDLVAKIFERPMGTFTGRPLEEFQKLERQLKKVMPWFHTIEAAKSFWFNEILFACVLCGVFVVMSPLLLKGFNQIRCFTIFANNSSDCERQLVGDYISSM